MDFGSEFTYTAASGADDGNIVEIGEERLSTPLVTPATNLPQPRGGFRWPFSSATPPAALPASAPPRIQQRTYRRRVDTNILNVNLGSLGGEVTVQTGEPQLCSNCGACLSAISPLTKGHKGTFDWTCEFCGSYQRLELDEGEIPVSDVRAVDYIIEPAPCAPVVSDGATERPIQGSLVIFVLDISGSMCVTTEVEGKVALRGDQTANLSRLRNADDARDQWLPGQRRDVTYISRLQAVQAAVNFQIEEMSKQGQQAQVALVTFAGDVTIYGDGAADPTKISGDRLNNQDELRRLGREAGRELCCIDQSASRLKDTVFSIEESGPTALGPAVVVALGMTDGKPGAKIVLCTDGLANVGLGALDVVEDGASEERTALERFYESLGETAMSQGTIVDVVSIRGDECDLENLGSLCEQTGGILTRVDPLGIQENFAGILQNPVLATNVHIKVLLHAGLHFRLDEGLFDQEQEPVAPPVTCPTTGGVAASGAVPFSTNQRLSVYSKVVGNATADTELSFEYSVKSQTEFDKLRLQQLERLPFQVQIEYTRLNGMKCMRVLSETRPVTQDKAVAERFSKLAIISSHVTQQTAKLAYDGDYTMARANSRAYQDIMQRCVTNSATPAASGRTFEAWNTDMEELDEQLMANEAEEEDEVAELRVTSIPISSKGRSRSSRKASRSKNDAFSSMLYSKKKASARMFSLQETEQEEEGAAER